MASTSNYITAGVMGWPVAHSRSPVLHNHWIAEHGMSGAYVLLPVEPARLEAAVRGLGALGFKGCNITIPHKVAAMALVDRVDELARKVGAINTIVVESDGTLTGRNTDVGGFIESLREDCPTWRADAGPVAVVGSGGAARAVITGLLAEGVREIRLTNRSAEKAQTMAAEFGPSVHARPWEQRHAMLEGCALLVNTTNQGMHGQPALDLKLDALPLTAPVSDIIYVPLETPLLAAARQRGHTTVNGLGMLINQARLAFEAWTGVKPASSAELLEKVARTF